MNIKNFFDMLNKTNKFLEFTGNEKLYLVNIDTFINSNEINNYKEFKKHIFDNYNNFFAKQYLENDIIVIEKNVVEIIAYNDLQKESSRIQFTIKQKMLD